MPRWGMTIDLAKCTACQACTVACQTENNIPCASPAEAQRDRILSWMKMLPEIEGEYPRVSMRMMPVACQHCDKPPCILVCPVRATGIDPEGVVRQTFGRCIGCRYCTTACPYTSRMFNWHTPEFAGDYREALNPDVSVRPKGVVEKCTLCHHRLIKAREEARVANRSLAEGDYIPACAEICPAGAITFGDVEDPNSAVSEQARSPRMFRLLDELGTKPKVMYLAEGEWSGGKESKPVS